MSVTLDSFFALVSIGTEVEKRKVELCADCGYFQKYRCELGYRTGAWRKLAVLLCSGLICKKLGNAGAGKNGAIHREN